MSVVQLAKNTFREFSEDECTTLAAAIAYSALFALFPLLLGGVALASTFVASPEVREQILQSALSYLPGSRDLVEDTLRGVMDRRGEVGLVSALLLLASGRSLFVAVIHSLNRAFEAETTRSLIRRLAVAFGLVFGVGLLLVLSLAVTAIMQLLGNIALFGIGPFGGTPLWGVLQAAVSGALSFLMFLLLYKIAPNTNQRWAEVIPGALIAAALFEVAKWGFVLYVRNFTNYEAVYGAIGAVIVLMTWFYFSALILLLGAEVGSEYMKLKRAEKDRNPVHRPAPTLLTSVREPPLARAAALVGTAFAFAMAFVLASRRRMT